MITALHAAYANLVCSLCAQLLKLVCKAMLLADPDIRASSQFSRYRCLRNALLISACSINDLADYSCNSSGMEPCIPEVMQLRLAESFTRQRRPENPVAINPRRWPVSSSIPVADALRWEPSASSTVVGLSAGVVRRLTAFVDEIRADGI